jgi:hypothetical protein
MTLGHGTWRLAGGRLTVVASNGKYAGAITKDNGTFHFSGADKDLDITGKYCH